MLIPLISMTSGCAIRHSRKTMPVRAPSVVMSADAAQLVENVNRADAAIHTLTATVTIQASVMKALQGTASDYTPIPGIILLRKPGDLRVLGRVPVVLTTAFDMASDGKSFTLMIPHNNKAIVGPDAVTKKSPNALENLRPFMFVDAMLVRAIRPEEQVLLTTDTDTIEDPSHKFLLEKREYDLTIVQPKPGSQFLSAVRVIHFNRTNLLPYQQDIYDKDGALAEQVIYGDYQDFGKERFPGVVTIRRPQDEYQIVLTIQKLTLNQDLKDDQFKVKIPEGIAIQKLD
jgi:hypothetical protein